LRIAEMPAEEVWDRPPAGVQARNVYFELVPLELLRGVVVENEVWASSEAATAARDRPLLDEIAAG
jgi:translation initiation factor 2B subunit (eIF-2B alpha/beta/delta family)